MAESDSGVWLVFPSANEGLCARNLPAWRERGYRVAVLQDRVRFACPADVVLEVETYEGWAASVNRLARETLARGARIVVAAGDDMLPEASRGAGDLAKEFGERFPDGFGVMQPMGETLLHAGNFCGSPWLGRAWCERMYAGAGPLWPGYRHNWADNELYWLARGMGVLWERPDLSQRHEHFSVTGAAKPGYWKANAERNDCADAWMFVERAWDGFPGHAPRGPTPGPRYDRRVFERNYRFFAEVHLAGNRGEKHAAWRPEERMRRVLLELAEDGVERVGVFGAGTHTRAVAGIFKDAPVTVACVIDESPALEGSSVGGVRVVGPLAARGMGLGAVVVSSNSREVELTRAAARLGLPVATLYGTPTSQANARAGTGNAS